MIQPKEVLPRPALSVEGYRWTPYHPAAIWVAIRRMHRDAIFPGLPESFMACGEEQNQGLAARGLSAARGILIGLGIAGLMWMLLAVVIIQIFFR